VAVLRDCFTAAGTLVDGMQLEDVLAEDVEILEIIDGLPVISASLHSDGRAGLPYTSRRAVSCSGYRGV
jgi:hypothetical protein